MFVVTLLRYWCRDYEDKLGELLASLLSARYPATSPNKRKRATAKHSAGGAPSGEQVLCHLDKLRQHCASSEEMQLYQLDGMQRALQQAQAAGSDTLRKNYGDLFALAEVNEENEPPPPPPPPTTSRTAKATASSTAKAGQRKAAAGAATTRERTAAKRPPPRDRMSESSDQSSEVGLLFVC